MRTIFFIGLLAGSALSAKLPAEDRVYAHTMAEQWHNALLTCAGITSGSAIVGATDASIKGIGRIPVISAGVALITLPLYFCAVKEHKIWRARANA